jgi:hypothetical protein
LSNQKKKVVLLEDVVDKLEEIADFCEHYLNTATGEFAILFNDMDIESDDDLLEEIDGSDDYVRLPDQYDIDEYNIMKDFAETVLDVNKRDRLQQALNGKKPFRHFKDTLNYAGLDEAYYAFRSLAFAQIARQWCEDNNIPYTARVTREEK